MYTGSVRQPAATSDEDDDTIKSFTTSLYRRNSCNFVVFCPCHAIFTHTRAPLFTPKWKATQQPTCRSIIGETKENEKKRERNAKKNHLVWGKLTEKSHWIFLDRPDFLNLWISITMVTMVWNIELIANVTDSFEISFNIALNLSKSPISEIC